MVHTQTEVNEIKSYFRGLLYRMATKQDIAYSTQTVKNKGNVVLKKMQVNSKKVSNIYHYHTVSHKKWTPNQITIIQ